MAEIMTPDHKHWRKFISTLKKASGDCKHDYTVTCVVLTKMGMDIQGSIEHLKVLGGYCDCEVLLNVRPESSVPLLETPGVIGPKPKEGRYESFRGVGQINVALYLTPSQLQPRMQQGRMCYSANGNEVRKELENLPILGEEDFDELRKTDAFPDAWIGKIIFFWRKLRLGPNNRMYVPFAYWQGRWRKGMRCLDEQWNEMNPAAIQSLI